MRRRPFRARVSLVDIDEDPGPIVPLSPISMMIALQDKRMMSAVVIPISILIV